MLILLRYGELALKSSQVRKKFEKKLIENLKNQLRDFDVEIKNQFGRIFVESKTDNSEVIEKIKNTPGIVSLSKCYKTDLDLKNVLEICSKIIENLQISSFGLKVSRAGTHEFTSQEIAIKLGDLIRQKFNLKVDLTDPDLWIFIEIRNKDTYIYTEKINCIGGLPVGIEGNILSFLENKFDLYSAILMAKRGCRIIPFSYLEFSDEQTEFLEILKKFDPDVKALKFDKKNLEEIVDFFKIKAIVSGKTIEDLDKLRNFENSEIPILFPCCALTKKEVLENLEKFFL